MSTKKDKLITIKKYQSYMQAEMAKQTLEDNGIKAFVSGENTANIYSLPEVQYAELQVMSPSAEQALQILEEAGQ